MLDTSRELEVGVFLLLYGVEDLRGYAGDVVEFLSTEVATRCTLASSAVHSLASVMKAWTRLLVFSSERTFGLTRARSISGTPCST